MRREEIARRMRENVVDEDKELIVRTFRSMVLDVQKFHGKEVGLQGSYPNFKFVTTSPQKYGLKYKDNVLNLELDESNKKISITKIGTTTQVVLDEIVASDEKLSCFDGEFKIEEVDDYLSKCFAKLLD